MKKIILALVVSVLSVPVFAHEGHHNTPGSLPLDGFDQVQATDEYFVKLKIIGDGVRISLFDHDNKVLPLNGIKLEGSAKFPKKSKTEKVIFTGEGDAFTAKVDAKGAHRYTLEIKVTREGKSEKAKFSVEPH